jgi:hypothetical protein
MKLPWWFSWPLVYLVFFLPVICFSAEFEDELEKSFSLRSMENLQITNLRGSVTVVGWSQEKIRVKAKRKVLAESVDQAKGIYATAGFRFQAVDGGYELSAEYGKGLGIEERVRERSNPRTSMDMVVYAPAKLKLRVWTMDGPVGIKSWTGAVEVRTATGGIDAEDLRSKSTTLLCSACNILAKNIRGSLRCMSGSGDVKVQDVLSGHIYIETTAGKQYLSSIFGDQLLVSQNGDIDARSLEGRIEFHTQEGRVQIKDGKGFVSGKTTKGAVTLEMLDWKFEDKAFIESLSGDISIVLPLVFSGELDVWSVYGRVKVGFPLQPILLPAVHTAFGVSKEFGPEPANHVRGRVGESTEELRIFSERGNVEVSKGFR